MEEYKEKVKIEKRKPESDYEINCPGIPLFNLDGKLMNEILEFLETPDTINRKTYK